MVAEEYVTRCVANVSGWRAVSRSCDEPPGRVGAHDVAHVSINTATRGSPNHCLRVRPLLDDELDEKVILDRWHNFGLNGGDGQAPTVSNLAWGASPDCGSISQHAALSGLVIPARKTTRSCFATPRNGALPGGRDKSMGLSRSSRSMDSRAAAVFNPDPNPDDQS